MSDSLVSNHKHPKNSILIVDDIPNNLHLLYNILVDEGYEVRSVTSGKMALASAMAAPPDLILLDINMPQMDGYEVCKRLKADAKTADIPVIFVSALEEVFDKMEAFANGGEDYVSKPYQAEEILARVSCHLKIGNLQRELQAKENQLRKEKGDRQATQRTLQSSVAELQALFGALDDVIWVIDVKGKYLKIEPANLINIHKPLNEIIGKTQHDVFPKQQAEEFMGYIRHSLKTGETVNFEYSVKFGNRDSWFAASVSPITNDMTIWVARDITKLKQLETELKQANQKLKRFNSLDSLTQVGSQSYGKTYLESAWEKSLKTKQPISFVIGDIDHFKLYNHQYGYEAGNYCLKQVAQTFKTIAKQSGSMIVRYGGDEFALIMPNADGQKMTQVVKALRQQLKKLQIVHVQSPIAKHITLSFGVVTTLPANDKKPEELVVKATQLLDTAKQAGGDRVMVKNFLAQPRP